MVHVLQRSPLDHSLRMLQSGLHYFNAMADKYEKLSGYSAVPPIAGYQSELMFEKRHDGK